MPSKMCIYEYKGKIHYCSPLPRRDYLGGILLLYQLLYRGGFIKKHKAGSSQVESAFMVTVRSDSIFYIPSKSGV